MYISAYADISIKELDNMEQLVQFFRSLSDETRLRIVILLTQGELCVCDLMVALDEPQSKISRHLAYLKHSGLISSKRVGVWMHYRIKDSLDELYKRQIDLLKDHLLGLPVFQEDIKKIIELKGQGGCKALAKFKSARRSNVHDSKREGALLP